MLRLVLYGFYKVFCNFFKKKVLQFEDDVKMAPGTSKSSKIGPQEGAKRAQEGAKRTYVGLSCRSSSPCWGVLGLMWACLSNFERHLRARWSKCKNDHPSHSFGSFFEP